MSNSADNRKPEWWRDFFSGLSVDLWRQAISEEQTRAEADFILKMLRLTPGARVLDVLCGSGRLSLELAARGITLTGVDLSLESLEEARSAGKRRQLNIVWEHREMRDLPWRDEFDGAFCFGNSFGYLDDEGNTEFLSVVHKTLKQGRGFVLDASSVAENVLPRIKPRTETQIGDILFIEENRYDHALGRLDTDYTFVQGKRVEKKFGSHRLYTYREICRLLEESGFEISAAFGSTGEEPFELGTQGLYLVATKNG